ncbi:RNA-DNA hybrid ribonuclease [Rhizophlyctis rosea]|nr:RNA-DNA hybrid ribonuclease [Rhizophlyctis rosea]
MPPKKKGGKAASAKKKKEAELEAAAQLRITELKALRISYGNNCKHFITEPIPAVVKRIDKAVTEKEDIDKVILNSMTLTLNDMYSFSTTFQAYSALGFVCFWMTRLDAKGLAALAKFFEVHPKVSTLHLIDCGITPATAGYLARIASMSPSVSTLVLDHNPLGSAGINAIFGGIRENKGTVLKRVSLRYCEGGVEGAEGIGVTLAGNITITEMDLTGNTITDDGLIPFATYLPQNTTLQILSLAANQIQNRPSPSFTPPLPASYPTPLSQPPPLLTIPGSTPDLPPLPAPLPTTPFAHFCISIGSLNSTLTRLDLRSNHVGDAGGECIVEMLKARKGLVAAKRGAGMEVLISERMREEMFDRIWDLNDAMAVAGGKGKKGGKKMGKK